MSAHSSAENLSKLAKPDKYVTVLTHSESMRFDCNGFIFFSGTKIKNIKKSETLSGLGLSPGSFLSLQRSTFLGYNKFPCTPARLVMAAFSWSLCKTVFLKLTPY